MLSLKLLLGVQWLEARGKHVGRGKYPQLMEALLGLSHGFGQHGLCPSDRLEAAESEGDIESGCGTTREGGCSCEVEVRDVLEEENGCEPQCCDVVANQAQHPQVWKRGNVGLQLEGVVAEIEVL